MPINTWICQETKTFQMFENSILISGTFGVGKIVALLIIREVKVFVNYICCSLLEQGVPNKCHPSRITPNN